MPWGAFIGGGVALICGLLTFFGVMYQAWSQKQPTIIKVSQQVATDAIATLLRERDECREDLAIAESRIADLEAELAACSDT